MCVCHETGGRRRFRLPPTHRDGGLKRHPRLRKSLNLLNRKVELQARGTSTVRGPIGVNPQLTIMATATRAARADRRAPGRRARAGETERPLRERRWHVGEVSSEPRVGAAPEVAEAFAITARRVARDRLVAPAEGVASARHEAGDRADDV